MESLFCECLNALGESAEILSEEDTSMVFKCFSYTFPTTKWGVINWSIVSNFYEVTKVTDILIILNEKKISATNVFILWNDSSLPCISVKLYKALEYINDVIAVSFDTWLFDCNNKYVIEFHHEGRISIGIT